MSFFSDIWKKIKTAFKSGADEVVDFLEPIARVIAPYISASLREVAYAAVMAAERQGGDWRQKRDAAFDAATDMLKSRGKEIPVIAINIAIEQAVARLKAA